YAARRAAGVEGASAHRESRDAARGHPPAAARVRRERIAIARIVEVVGAARDLGPGRAVDGQGTERGEGGAVGAGQDDAGRGARLRELLGRDQGFRRLVARLARLGKTAAPGAGLLAHAATIRRA